MKQPAASLAHWAAALAAGDALAALVAPLRVGRVTEATGTLLRAAIPEARVGEVCRIERADGGELLAEVVGFDSRGAVLMPFGHLSAVAVDAPVFPTDREARVPAGPALCGRVIDALGRPLDDGGPLATDETAPLLGPPPNPLQRQAITEPVATGVRAIDGLLTVGRGQRVGIFAAAGVGKSTLLGMIARFVDADRVVLALIGERGREVRGFLEQELGAAGLRKATVVVSTSDEPAVLRLRAAFTATAIAEAARAQGQRVVLLMDSVTRFARALRDVGLAAGEPPGRQGYPASVFAALPRLFERAGNDAYGSITAFYTVLVTGNDLEEPVADETLSLLDGHLILSRELAGMGQFPAIDVLPSVSRVMHEVCDREQMRAAQAVREVLEFQRRNQDKIQLGLFRPQNPREERLRDCHADVLRFLRQDRLAQEPLARTRGALFQLVERLGPPV